jgi:hypothetical protein
MMMMVMVIDVNEYIGDNQGHTQGGCWAPAPSPPKPKFKWHRFCRYCGFEKLSMISPAAKISH